MAIGSAASVLAPAQTAFNKEKTASPEPAQTLSAAAGATQEAEESRAQTQQEANRGDPIARRKEAKIEATAKEDSGSTGEPAAQIEGKGQEVNVPA